MLMVAKLNCDMGLREGASTRFSRRSMRSTAFSGTATTSACMRLERLEKSPSQNSPDSTLPATTASSEARKTLPNERCLSFFLISSIRLCCLLR